MSCSILSLGAGARFGAVALVEAAAIPGPVDAAADIGGAAHAVLSALALTISKPQCKSFGLSKRQRWG